MDPRLKEQLVSVRRSIRRQRTLQVIATSLFAGAIALWIYTGWQSPQGITLYSATTSAAVILVGSWSIAQVVSALTYRDLRRVAGTIEHTHSDLNERLLSAIDQKIGETGTYTYLQRRVIDSALEHAGKVRWTESVGGEGTKLNWFALAAAFVLLLGVTLTSLERTPAQASSAGRELVGSEFLVEPGDADVERGSNLLVTATFASDSIPTEVWLVASNGTQDVRTPMNRNLDDPTFGGFLTEIDRDLTYRVLAEDRTSKDYRVSVFEYPKMVRCDAAITPPEYSNQPSKTIADTVRITVPEGTQLVWQIRLNKPVASAKLVEKDGTEIVLVPGTEENVVVADVMLLRSHLWTLRLVDEQGRENKFPENLIAQVLPNKPAAVRLVAGGDAVVSPIEEFAIAAEVNDDFGIKRVGVTFAVGSNEPQVVELASFGGRAEESKTESAKFRSIKHVVDLESAKAEADQLVSYHFWAEDVGSDGNARKTVGDMFFAEVRPFEQIFREGSGGSAASSQQPPSAEEQQQAQQAEQLAELQKQIVAATWNLIRAADLAVEVGDQRLSEPLVPDAQVILESQQSAIAQLEELTANLPPDRSPELVQAVSDFMNAAAGKFGASIKTSTRSPLDDAMTQARGAYQALLRLRAREFDVMQQQQQQQQQGGSASQANMQRQLDQLELKNDPSRYQQERTAQPQPEQTAAQQAQAALSRLKDLARRQADINEQLKAMELELQQAETEEEREEARRKLERLREQQQELLRDLDDLASELNSQSDSEAAQQAAEQLQQTRENLREASSAMENNQPSQALASGSRAERSLDELKDEFQRESAAALAERMQELRSQSQQLAEDQKEITEQLKALEQPSEGPGLRTEGNNRQELTQRLQTQSERVDQLVDLMRETVRESEQSQPLLAEQLYEAQAKTQRDELSLELEFAADLLERSFDPQARQANDSASQKIDDLDERLQRAANSVLGDPVEALTRADNELSDLAEQLASERDDQSGEAGDPSSNGRSGAAGEAETGNAGEEEGEAREGGSPQAGSEPQPGSAAGEGQSSGGGQRDGQQDSNDQQEPQDSQPGSGSPQQSSGQPGSSANGSSSQPGSESPQERQRNEQRGDANGRATGSSTQTSGGGLLDGNWTNEMADGEEVRPITGDGFREWAEQLRQVEDLLQDPELRAQAAGIRDRARELRREFVRHAAEPQWSELEEILVQPIRRLQADVRAELLRRTAERNAVVPMDRDPVPDKFAEAVREYYEQVGAKR